MSARISLSRRDACDVWNFLTGKPLGQRRVDDLSLTLQAQLTASPKKRAATKARKSAKGAKRATKRERTAEVREQVMARADGKCECGCGRSWGDFVLRPTLDHFEGRARSESVETCWALADGCHYLKTNNSPSAEVWLVRWITHCDRHGYTAEASRARARLASLSDVAEAAALTGGGR